MKTVAILILLISISCLIKAEEAVADPPAEKNEVDTKDKEMSKEDEEMIEEFQKKSNEVLEKLKQEVFNDKEAKFTKDQIREYFYQYQYVDNDSVAKINELKEKYDKNEIAAEEKLAVGITIAHSIFADYYIELEFNKRESETITSDQALEIIDNDKYQDWLKNDTTEEIMMYTYKYLDLPEYQKDVNLDEQGDMVEGEEGEAKTEALPEGQAEGQVEGKAEGQVEGNQGNAENDKDL